MSNIIRAATEGMNGVLAVMRPARELECLGFDNHRNHLIDSLLSNGNSDAKYKQKGYSSAFF